MNEEELQELVDHIKDMILEIPVRVEHLDGQDYKYVKLEEVLSLLENVLK